MDNFAKFDAADYLDSEEVIAEYLIAALEDENPDVWLTAVADVAKTRGMRERTAGSVLMAYRKSCRRGETTARRSFG